MITELICLVCKNEPNKIIGAEKSLLASPGLKKTNQGSLGLIFVLCKNEPFKITGAQKGSPELTGLTKNLRSSLGLIFLCLPAQFVKLTVVQKSSPVQKTQKYKEKSSCTPLGFIMCLGVMIDNSYGFNSSPSVNFCVTAQRCSGKRNINE